MTGLAAPVTDVAVPTSRAPVLARRQFAEVPTPFPFAAQLPALLQEDDFIVRFTQGMDEVLAPVFAVLDSFHAYLDPDLAPIDFVEWLASWVGAHLDENWDEQQKRVALRRTVGIHRLRGTRLGVVAAVELAHGIKPEIEDSGGVVTSQVPGTAWPGRSKLSLLVRVRVSGTDSVDLPSVDAIVAGTKPAHVPHRVEVLRE